MSTRSTARLLTYGGMPPPSKSLPGVCTAITGQPIAIASIPAIDVTITAASAAVNRRWMS